MPTKTPNDENMLINFQVTGSVGGPFSIPAQVHDYGFGSYEDRVASAIAKRNHCICTSLKDNVNGVYEAILSKPSENYDFRIVGTVYFKVY